jgi:hypothetical protein
MRNIIGEKYRTTEGYIIEIIQFFNSKNCTIKFNDGLIIENRIYFNVKKGHVKNPHHKSVCEVGYLGVGDYSHKTHPKIYKTWQDMLSRCYDKKCQQKQPSYIGCSVIEKWHNFQLFAKWFEENYKENKHLDKDILVKGNKIYSPNTCCFIPQEINSLFTKSNNSRGQCPIGVNKAGNKYVASININYKTIYLGIFKTPCEAFEVYKTAKENRIKEVAEKYKEKITKPAYIALINYQVEITD